MTGVWRLLVLLAVVWAASMPAHGDEFRPAYLQLRQLDSEQYEVLWKVPALDEAKTLGIRPVFPEGTRVLSPVQSRFAGGTAVQRWRIRADGGLVGKAIEFPTPSSRQIEVLVRVERSDGTVQIGRVSPAGQHFVVTASPGTLEVARAYTVLGTEHILTGFDHLMFVLALILLVQGKRRLIATVTAFTVAHSLTLLAATLGWVHVNARLVEAAIALSIIFVAVEIVHGRQGRPGLTQRYPWSIAFLFGLLHGFGFAGALAEIGLPQGSIPTALLFFNVGVEIGQLLFIAAMLLIIAIARTATRKWDSEIPEWTWRLPPYAIGGLASFWLLARITAA